MRLYTDNDDVLIKEIPFIKLIDYMKCKIGTFPGKVSSVFFFSELLPEKKIIDLFSLGPNYVPEVITYF